MKIVISLTPEEVVAFGLEVDRPTSVEAATEGIKLAASEAQSKIEKFKRLWLSQSLENARFRSKLVPL